MSRRRYNTRAARLEGGFWCSEKAQAVSLAGRGLYACMLSYCADKMTDGRVPLFVVPAFVGGEDPAPLIAELVAASMVEERDGGLHVLSYEKHNITKGEWEEQKADARDRKARSRGKSVDVTRDMSVTSRGSHASVSTSTSTSTSSGSDHGSGARDRLTWQRVIALYADWYERLTTLPTPPGRWQREAEDVLRQAKAGGRDDEAAAALVQDAVAALARSKWWEAKGMQVPDFGHFARHFGRYAQEAMSGQEAQQTNDTKRQMQELFDERLRADTAGDAERVRELDGRIAAIGGDKPSRADRGVVVPANFGRGA